MFFQNQEIKAEKKDRNTREKNKIKTIFKICTGRQKLKEK